MSLIVSIIFFKPTEEPVPKVLGYVCIPISFTLNPCNLDFIASSAPTNGLLVVNLTFFKIDLLNSLDPVDTSLKFVLNRIRNNIL